MSYNKKYKEIYRHWKGKYSQEKIPTILIFSPFLCQGYFEGEKENKTISVNMMVTFVCFFGIQKMLEIDSI